MLSAGCFLNRNMNKKNITSLYHKSIVNRIDYYFAAFISGLCSYDDSDIFLAAALVSNAAGKGHVYLDLASVADKPLIDGVDDDLSFRCPRLDAWTDKLYASCVVGRPGDFCPLILDAKNRLYLYRYWDYEKRLSDAIKRRAQKDIDPLDAALFKTSLEQLFPKASNSRIDWQKVATFTAAFKNLLVISGGPGTGKTYTVAGILALLIELKEKDRLEIFMAAPTGKAAAKLSETMAKAKIHLNCRVEVAEAIPSKSFTIHRMLKTIPGSPYFIHNAENQLDADVVIVDEASMVDLALMVKLFEAVPEDARLILIGDKDQLASVEAGSVLGDICDRNRIHGFSEPFRKKYNTITSENLVYAARNDQNNSVLQDCIVTLKHSFRFADSSAIGEFSRSINSGDADKVIDLLQNHPQIRWQQEFDRQTLPQAFSQAVIKGYSEYLNAVNPVKALDKFNRFKILCAVNIGPYGVNALNRLAENSLTRESLINPNQEWYRGRPILITRNDYDLGLYNGDMGVTLPDPDSGSQQLHVYFQGDSGELRRFAPHRLPEHETLFAMTVHKSQGSEFDDILLILPQRDYPVLTRELLYTAITRAKRRISIWGTEDVIRTAVMRKIKRASGLRDALWT